jgi:deoxyribodipyrimidine photo-lyase
MTDIVWLRRDLQIADNASIHFAGQNGGKPQLVFVLDSDVLSRFHNKRDRRLSFIANALAQIDQQLRAKNARLLVLHGSAREILPQLAQKLGGKIYAGEDYEPATISRDEYVAQHAELILSKQHMLHSPKKIVKDDGSAYKVFTPYSNKWREQLSEFDSMEYYNDDVEYADFAAVQAKLAGANFQILDASNPAEMLEHIGYEYVDEKQWDVSKGQEMLKIFVAEKIEQYSGRRDIPAVYGTSRLSPYLRFGLVTPRQAYNAASKAKLPAKWINELIWREFYAMILLQFPETINTEFQPQYRHLEWGDNAEFVAAFKQGKTGYPIVDAGVRELLQTGWMHNRVRMIVGSFFTKNLLQDWRMGEEFFAQHLMDYDLASNVGGWQWSSSTGTDAAPYFRVFNPVLQSRKFDSQGDYIRRYVPEIAHLSNAEIHAPWESANPPAAYPAPIVDHFAARDRAIAAFKI